jgi:hypothetical protein
MASLVGVVVRHERRLRFRFDAELSPAAFQSTRFYAVTCTDGHGVSPPIAGALVVGADLHELELALGADLVDGASYEVRVAGAPTSDGQTADGFARVRPGAQPTTGDADTDDADRVLYGIDLVHDGGDYVESTDGDLATIEGLPNLEGAIARRLASDGLPWDSIYGAKPRRYVDGAVGALSTLRGALIREALNDDRVEAADATLADDDETFDVDVTPVGTDASLTLQVPTR